VSKDRETQRVGRRKRNGEIRRKSWSYNRNKRNNYRNTSGKVMKKKKGRGGQGGEGLEEEKEKKRNFLKSP
jgi:hypothetical protein